MGEPKEKQAMKSSDHAALNLSAWTNVVYVFVINPK